MSLSKEEIAQIAQSAANKVNVGKGCECIYPFEKHYIDMVFEGRIKEEKRKLAEVKEILAKMPPESRERYEGAEAGFKVFIHDLEAVRERFEAMPSCNPSGNLNQTAAATEYVTITDPGKTTFKAGEIYSRRAFEEENERVRKLGEKPATGR